MDIGTVLLILLFAYGIGVFWYDLLPGRLSERAWRVAAYPFVAIVLAEALIPIGPVIGGLHVVPAVVAALIGVLLDWLVTTLRHPAMVRMPEAPSGQASVR
jgi:predicted MFS family arabinose efflux permease